MNASIREQNLRAAALWGSGGKAYDRISRTHIGTVEHCVERLNPTIGERIADVATGTSWTSRAVTRLGAQVVGFDIADPLLDAAQEIAQEQKLVIDYRLGDAEALPVGDAEFDAVISTFGVMFAPVKALVHGSSFIAGIRTRAGPLGSRPGDRLVLDHLASGCNTALKSDAKQMMSILFASKNVVLSRWLRWITTAILGLAFIAESNIVQAGDTLSIADFVGHFRGEAQVQAGDRFFIQQLRDAEVELRTEAEGFWLKWTTVIHYDEGDKTKVRRRNAEMRFAAGPMPNQFRSLEPLEPFTERPAAWAYIDGNTLVVHVLSILADGNYELQTYERSLSGNTMTLHFSRVFPGRPELVVSGHLIRQPE
jgi:hypothetical protein